MNANRARATSTVTSTTVELTPPPGRDRPQPGHASALVDTATPQSLHFFMAMVNREPEEYTGRALNDQGPAGSRMSTE